MNTVSFVSDPGLFEAIVKHCSRFKGELTDDMYESIQKLADYDIFPGIYIDTLIVGDYLPLDERKSSTTLV